MSYTYQLAQLPKPLKSFLAVFVLALSIGFFTGIDFVKHSNQMNPDGIQENYLGNEDSQEGDVMIFEKGEREMLTIVHTHILSMSMIFFLLGLLTYGTRLKPRFKHFLMIEPLISVLVTFGGLWFMWRGMTSLSYIVMVSGILMTLSFTVSALVVLYSLLFQKR